MATRPAIFKWRQTEPVLILSAVRWYLRYSLSLRDVEELLKERGVEVDHTTVWHCVQRYGPELEERLQADQQILARGRDLRSSKGPLVLPVSGRRFRRRHD
jgi:transposase-like protein